MNWYLLSTKDYVFMLSYPVLKVMCFTVLLFQEPQNELYKKSLEVAAKVHSQFHYSILIRN